MKDLITEWQYLWGGLGIYRGTLAHFLTLTTYYAEPHRKYHTLKHIDDCIKKFNLFRNLAEDPIAVKLALFFHDAVYDPRRGDNESRSADLAKHVMGHLHREYLVPRVEPLILVTRHKDPPQTRDEKLIVDIDLSILGANEEEFDRYETAIRQEFLAFITPAEFHQGRLDFLKRFLERAETQGIFHTDQFRSLYATQAINNMKRSIDRLESTQPIEA